MAGKSNFSDVQRQDRNGILRRIGIIVLIIVLLTVALFVWHALAPEKGSKNKGKPQEQAQLTMVPTRISYYDPSQEQSYSVGADYIIITDKENGNIRVSADGSVALVSSDGTFLKNIVDASEASRFIDVAMDIKNKDDQAGMALSGIESKLGMDEEPVSVPSETDLPSPLDYLYSKAEELGYGKDAFIRQSYIAGGSPEAAAKLMEMGASAEDVIRSIMKTEEKKKEDSSDKGLSIEMEHAGLADPTPTTPNYEDGKIEYPEWMQDTDPTVGLNAALDNLAAAASSGGSSSAWDETNKNKEKKDWMEQQQNIELTSRKLTRYDLVAGTTVPITIVTGVNTDLPGSIVGIVRQDVYDTRTGTNVLIPKGSRLMATYNNGVSFGQKSVQIAWNMLITPDGYEFSLPGFAGITPDGYAGVAGKYNGHFWQMLGGAVLGSLLDWGAVYATDKTGAVLGEGELSSLFGALTGSVINTSVNAGQQYASMWANRQPTIKIKTGTQTQLLVNQTISLKRPGN